MTEEPQDARALWRQTLSEARLQRAWTSALLSDSVAVVPNLLLRTMLRLLLLFAFHQLTLKHSAYLPQNCSAACPQGIRVKVCH